MNYKMNLRTIFDKNIKSFLINNTIFIILIIYFLLSLIFVPNFASVYNITTMFLQCADLLIISCGVTFVVLNGGIDFSGSSIIALGSVIGASIMSESSGILKDSHFSIIIAIFVMLAIGLIFGIVNGISVVYFKMPSFIVTLATMGIGSGIAVWYTKSDTIFDLPSSFTFLGSGKILFIPVPVIIAFLCIIYLNFILSKTLFGRHVYAIGTNPKASFISGLPVKRTIFKLFIISGICAAIAGILMTARNEAGIPGLASSIFIDVIASVIIGGTSVFGGKGSILGTVIGVLFITVLNNSLDLMRIDWYIILIIKGMIILFAAFLDAVKVKQTN
jgi:ribose/xylose/arabinose/galactoside ABC-type transport system permease subunit